MINRDVEVLRQSIRAITQILTESNVKVTQRGVDAYTKCNSRTGVIEEINLPYLPDDASEQLIQAVQGYLDHEVGHALFTDFSAIKSVTDDSLKSLHNIVEDAFVERKMAEKFRGCAYNLGNVSAFYREKYLDKLITEGDPDMIKRGLAVAGIRALSGQQSFIDYMNDKWHHLGDFKKKIEPLSAKLSTTQSTKDCLEMAKQIKKILHGDTPPAQPGPPQPDDESDDGEGEPDESGTETQPSSQPDAEDESENDEQENEPQSAEEEDEDENAESEEPEDESEGAENEEDGDSADEEESESDENEGESDSSEGDNDDGDSSEDHDEDGQSDDESGEDDESGDQGETDEGESESSVNSEEEEEEEESGTSMADIVAGGLNGNLGTCLAESVAETAKSSDYLIYTDEFDKIGPYEDIDFGRLANDREVSTFEDAVQHMMAPIEKDIERAVCAKSASTHTGGFRSGKLHAAALSRLKFGDDRVFRRKQINTTKDVDVELVIDCSGSMSHGKIALAATAAFTLSTVLERLGINNEVIGFTTADSPYGVYEKMREDERNLGVRYARYRKIVMPIFKRFGEKMTMTVKKRLASVAGDNGEMGDNLDGESVMIAAKRLMAQKGKGKIMIVLSDGMPASYGNADLNHHLRETVRQIEASGINVVGIGINSKAVESFYSKFILVEDISQLPTVVARQLKQMLLAGAK